MCGYSTAFAAVAMAVSILTPPQPVEPEALARVGLPHRFLEVRDGDAGVDRRRLEVGVAEEFLDVADVGPALNQVRSARVAEGVGRTLPRDPGVSPVSVDPRRDDTLRQMPTAGGKEDDVDARIADEQTPPVAQVVIERQGRPARDRHHAIFSAFPTTDEEETLRQVHL